MKQKKEKSHYWRYILIFFIFLLLWYFINPPKQEQRFCEANPEKCVCEEEIRGCLNGYTLDFKTGNSWCHKDYVECKNEKFRKKTQSELDIDDCNGVTPN